VNKGGSGVVLLALLVTACGGGGGGGGITPSTPAPTASPTPNFLNGTTTISRYMGTVTAATLNTEGCQMAQGVSNQSKSGIVVLDYGEPYTENGDEGTSDYGAGNPFVTDAQIATAVEGYLDGYAQCNEPATGTLILAIGTSNYGSEVTPAHATAWAAMIAQLNAYVAAKTYPNESVAAAADMETGWSSASVTRGWLDAYVAATSTIPIYDYGDAGGCPSTSYAAGNACGGGWTQADVAYVAGGAGANVRAIPEIYNTSGTTANQWGWIGAGAADGGHPITFSAVMTQVGSCGTGCSGLNNTPAQALQLLNAQLATHTETASDVMTMSTDITTAN
jgi:hypothetical protein